jgi:hypothetical protein
MEIQLRDEDEERRRASLREMSDKELLEAGKMLANLADPKTQHGKPNPAFVQQLEEARAEWRRRHPRQADECGHR